MIRQRGKHKPKARPILLPYNIQERGGDSDDMARSCNPEAPSRRSRLLGAFTKKWNRIMLLVLLVLVVLISCLHVYLSPIINGRIDSNIELYSQLLDQWTIVRPPNSTTTTTTSKKTRKNRGTVVAMLASSPSQNMMRILSPSIHDKTTYAHRHNYSLVLCPLSLDEARDANWSKLKLISLLFEEGYDTVLWLDVDTIINNKNMSVEDIIHLLVQREESENESGVQQSLLAQVDLHRQLDSLYINSGVMIIRNTPQAIQLLETAYRQWQVVLLKGLIYFNSEQDGLCLALGSKDVDLFGRWRRQWNSENGFNPKRPSKIVNGGYSDEIVGVFKYGRLWALPKDVKDDATFVVHLPGCYGEACVKTLLDMI